MKLLVIRHGIAMEREDFAPTGQSDDLRPLTAEGIEEMKKVTEGLRTEVKTLDQVASSPLVRARQTAEIVAAEYGIQQAEITDTLVPGASMESFEAWCASRADMKIIAVVGHEPHLSHLVTWLMTGRNDSRIRMRKGGACLVEFDAAIRGESGTLSWLLTPRQLAAERGVTPSSS